MRCGGGLFDARGIATKYLESKVAIENPNLWDDPNNAKKLLSQHSELEDEVKDWEKITKHDSDIKSLLDSVSEDDSQMLNFIQEEIESLQNETQQRYIRTLFSSAEDASNCFLTIHAGSGGLEAEDWAKMLWEMYIKYASTSGFSVTCLDESFGDDGGIKSATIKIIAKEKKYPYGWLKGESGVHRLVRISPYDKDKQRHTSFASVFVSPEIDDDVEIKIEDKDIRIDTYRASGAGGQHVNKTDSAIRITHLSTGVVVQCQNDRSQHRNRDEAFKMLRARLYKYQMDKKRLEQNLKEGEKKEISWGSQIRSYVAHPYQMVKDHRTAYEVPNFDKVVFEGFLEGFLIAFLKANIG